MGIELREEPVFVLADADDGVFEDRFSFRMPLSAKSLAKSVAMTANARLRW